MAPEAPDREAPAARAPILHIFSTFDVGGPQARFIALLPGLGEMRHLVVAMDDRWGALEAAQAAGQVTRLPLALMRGGLMPNVRALRRAIAVSHPRVVVGYNWGAIEAALAARLAGVPHVQVEDGFGPDESERRHIRRNIARRLFLRFAGSRVIVPSHGLERVAGNEWGIPARRLVRIANGVGAARAALRSDRQGPSRFARHPDEIVVGTVAALRREKDLVTLVRATAARPQLRLVIAGEGPERAQIEAAAERLGVARRVELLGHVNEPATLYPQFDLFAMSSITEQLPMALLEAMAAGLPIAATAVGDIAASVAPANRRYVTTGGSDELGASIGALAESPALRAALGEANRRRACEEFDTNRMTAAWLAVLESAADERPRPRGGTRA